jgi:hypothetical protein
MLVFRHGYQTHCKTNAHKYDHQPSRPSYASPDRREERRRHDPSPDRTSAGRDPLPVDLQEYDCPIAEQRNGDGKGEKPATPPCLCTRWALGPIQFRALRGTIGVFHKAGSFLGSIPVGRQDSPIVSCIPSRGRVRRAVANTHHRGKPPRAEFGVSSVFCPEEPIRHAILP